MRPEGGSLTPCDLNRYSGTSPTWPCVRWSGTRTLSERECTDIRLCELHRYVGDKPGFGFALTRMWRACSSEESSCHLFCVRVLALFSLVWLMMYEYYRTLFVPKLDLAQVTDCKTLRFNSGPVHEDERGSVHPRLINRRLGRIWHETLRFLFYFAASSPYRSSVKCGIVFARLET